MSRKKCVMGNWKMNGNKAVNHALLQHIQSIQVDEAIDVVVFPPYLYIEKTSWELRHSQLKIGAQNVSEFQDGAFTGDISATMIKDVGCDYVLVGHSERRQYFHETNEMIAKKCLRAFEANLKPVLCVGETLEEKRAHLTDKIVLEELHSVLNLRDLQPYLSQLILAYEPVWAIGSGLTASPQEAQKVHQLLREALVDYDLSLQHVPILYGGSVKAANAKSLFEMPDIDGALVGGASLNGEEFREICHLIKV